MYFMGLLQNIALCPYEKDALTRESADGAHAIRGIFTVIYYS